MHVYRITGDDEWLKKVLPKLEKGIDYITSDEKRFDRNHGLVKRSFTIDTWDFAYKQSDENRRIPPKNVNVDNARRQFGRVSGDESACVV